MPAEVRQRSRRSIDGEENALPRLVPSEDRKKELGYSKKQVEQQFLI